MMTWNPLGGAVTEQSGSSASSADENAFERRR
jgi:hypothetical protein